MPILRISNYIDYYRLLAASSDNHEMSGRGSDVAATQFANSRILEALELTADDRLLDIGCGDGTLLEAAKGAKKRLGVVPTEEEKSKLQRALPDITFLTGTAQQIPLESGSVSRIVCNSVLILLPSEDAVRTALNEIARVASQGAIVFLGEIPEADELWHFRKYSGNSVVGFLIHELSRKGFRAFLSAGRSVAAALLRRQMLVLNSAKLFHSPPERFSGMGAEYGLLPMRHFKYLQLDKSGRIVESALRYNYVFRKRITPAS
jgi:SAM-dependent methyltransferase